MASKLIDVSRAIRLAVDAATSTATAKAVGNYMENQIRTRTRVGKGSKKFRGGQTKLKIKEVTKKQREWLKSKGELSSKTSPAKANLTRSGKMLDTLHSRYDRGSTTISVQVAPSQQKKVDELDQQGHKFLNLTKGEFNNVIRIMVKSIVKKLKQSL